MGSNLRDFLEGRLLWFGELVLCGSGPWIIRWLGRLLLRLDQRACCMPALAVALVIWTVA